MLYTASMFIVFSKLHWTDIVGTSHQKGDTSISSVAEHVWLQGHQMDFRNYTILAQEAGRHQWNLGLFSAKTILTVSWDCYPQYITASFHRFNF